MRFLHIADVHLGNNQYNKSERFNDFGSAFWNAVELAVRKKVDAVVIAGDLFHKATVDPITLLQAERGLNDLAEARIPTIAVTGNHDKARFRDQVSWLEYLAQQGLLVLLAPEFEDQSFALLPWNADRAEPSGGYLDIQGVRFIGVPWLGAGAQRLLAELPDACKDLDWTGIDFTVLITHAGIEGQMPHMPGGLSLAQLEPLKGCVDYLALGHLHKPYAVADWIYNPGSLETSSFDEAAYRERGAYLVEVHADGGHTAELINTRRRPFFSLKFETDYYRTPDELMDGLADFLQSQAKDMRSDSPTDAGLEFALPVVRLILSGNLTFDRAELEINAVRKLLADRIEGLVYRVENRTTPLGMEISAQQNMNREELEQIVFEGLVASDTRYSVQREAWSAVARQIKVLALEGSAPEDIFDLLDQHMKELEKNEHVDH